MHQTENRSIPNHDATHALRRFRSLSRSSVSARIGDKSQGALLIGHDLEDPNSLAGERPLDLKALLNGEDSDAVEVHKAWIPGRAASANSGRAKLGTRKLRKPLTLVGLFDESRF